MEHLLVLNSDLLNPEIRIQPSDSHDLSEKYNFDAYLSLNEYQLYKTLHNL